MTHLGTIQGHNKKWKEWKRKALIKLVESTLIAGIAALGFGTIAQFIGSLS